MSDHLPECDDDCVVGCDRCICLALRACEARVRASEFPLGVAVGKHDGFLEGYAEALDAARDAVAALPSITLNSLRRDGSTPSYDVAKVTDALAAIDALRGDA